MSRLNQIIFENTNKNLVIDKHISDLDKLILDFNIDLETYNTIKENIKAKVIEFNSKDPVRRNIYVDKIDIPNKPVYLGCYKNTKVMEYTGNMKFKQCSQNAINMNKSFFSLSKENGKSKCYVGNELDSIIQDGQQYKMKPLWASNTKQTSDTPILKVLETCFAVVDSNNNVLFSNDIMRAKEELENKMNAVQPIQPTQSCRLLLDNNGILKLIRKSDDYQLWKSNQNVFRNSITVFNWVPENNTTCKYKRSYMSSNEFLDINESMSSQNGKYKMKFLKNGVMKLFGASTACVNRNRIGNKTTTSLHTINNTAYNVAEKSSSNSNSDETYFNLSLGDCISRCDNNSVCAAVEYKKGNVSSCELKNDIGEVYKTKNTQMISKNINNPYDDSELLGKVGYLDENDELHEYPKNMLKYNNQYKLYKSTTSDGNEIDIFKGSKVDGIIRCNELKNCGGFVYNRKNKTISLRDNQIFPIANKMYSKYDSLYTRKFNIDNHPSCSKGYQSVNVNMWKNYELLNKVSVMNRDTHKCGIINYIDTDMKELEVSYMKLTTYTKSVNEIIKKLVKLNVKIKDEVLFLQDRMNNVVINIIDSNIEMATLIDEYKKEGFISKPNIITQMHNDKCTTYNSTYNSTSMGTYIAYTAFIGICLSSAVLLIRR